MNILNFLIKKPLITVELCLNEPQELRRNGNLM